MEPWLIWLIITISLAAVEILLQTVWMLCLAVGALAAGIASLCGAEIATQIVVLAIASVGAFIFMQPLFKKWYANRRHREPSLQTGMDALLGRKARLTAPLHPDGHSRVRIDGDNWQVVAPKLSQTLPSGTEVTVKGHTGNMLIVEQ